MNKQDLERMMSLVDDRYVNELFSEKISMSGKRHFLTFAGCAAAIIAVIAGINILVDNSSPDISDLNQIRTEITVTESGMPYSGINGDDENFDYSQYFKSGSLYWDSFYSSTESDGRTYFFDGEYLTSIVPFDSFFDGGFGSAMVACDADKKAVKSELRYCDFSTKHYINLSMCSNGKIISQTEGKPVNRNGVDVYGNDEYMYQSTDISRRVLYFNSNGTDYYLSLSADFDYEEAVMLMDSIIYSGFSPADFDTSKGGKSNQTSGNLSLSKANKLRFFEGYVPQIQSVDFGNDKQSYASAHFTNYYDKGEGIYFSNWKEMTLCRQTLIVSYQEQPNSFYEDTNDLAYIKLQYDSDISSTENYAGGTISGRELSREALDSYGDFYETGDGSIFYYCTIEFDTFYIDVSAKNCSVDAVWEVLSGIPNT